MLGKNGRTGAKNVYPTPAKDLLYSPPRLMFALRPRFRGRSLSAEAAHTQTNPFCEAIA